jgi:hypothetical protein
VLEGRLARREAIEGLLERPLNGGRPGGA